MVAVAVRPAPAPPVGNFHLDWGRAGARSGGFGPPANMLDEALGCDDNGGHMAPIRYDIVHYDGGVSEHL